MASQEKSTTTTRRPVAPPSKKGAKNKKKVRKPNSWGNAVLAWIRSFGGEEYEQHQSMPTLERLRTITGILLLGLWLFVVMCLVFFVVDTRNINSQIYSVAESGEETSFMGTWGIQLSNTLFNGGFGWGSFLFSTILFLLGCMCLWLKREHRYNSFVRMVQIGFISVWVSMFLSTLQRLLNPQDSVLLWGGELGQLFSGFVAVKLGDLGLVVFYVVSLLIMLVLFSSRVLLMVNTPPRLSKPEMPDVSMDWWTSLKERFTRTQGEGIEETDEETDEDEEEDGDDEQSLEGDLSSEDDEQAAAERQEDVFQITLPSEQEEEEWYQPREVMPRVAVAPQTQVAEVEDELLVTVPTDDLIDEEFERGEYTPGMLLKYYQKPSIDLLKDYGSNNREIDRDAIETTRQLIIDTLASFKVDVTPTKATIGPTVTLYEIIPNQGVKISRIKSLENDLMRALESEGIRIIAPLPGKGTVGIEVPNRNPQTVSMRSIMASKQFNEAVEKMQLPVGIGKTITNEPFIFDLAKLPHLLVAGATGQGKSVGLNALITSLLYSKRPEELKLVMIDPKMVEFSIYEDLQKHFMAMTPDMEEAVITDMTKVVPTLNALCIEMDNRLKKLSEAKVRNVKDYNELVREGKLSRLKGFEFMPYIVVIVDEWADLIMTSGREAEQPIARLAQKARAVGIHLVLATQRPSTDVITGLIKANFPGRIAFKVSQGIDSITILGNPSAHNLIGRGDMLFYQGNDLIRIQCAFMDTSETESIVSYISRQESEGCAYELPEYVPEGGRSEERDGDSGPRDSAFEEAARLVVSNQMGSASFIQRKMAIGFARAGRLMDQLEDAGIVGPQRGSKPRDVLVPDLMSLETLLSQM